MSFAIAALTLLASSAAAFPYIPGPASQAAQPAWLAQLYANRSAQRAAVNYSGAVYDEYLLFSPGLHIVPQSHLYDRFLYDPVKGAADPAKGWTVDRFLDDLDSRYGGVDGVLLWNTYPNLGVDERSQFDLLGDVPGGLEALRDVVAQFNARGVRVGIPYNPWCVFARAPANAEPANARPNPQPHTPPQNFPLTQTGTSGRPGATRLTRPCSRKSPRRSARISLTATRWGKCPRPFGMRR